MMRAFLCLLTAATLYAQLSTPFPGRKKTSSKTTKEAEPENVLLSRGILRKLTEDRVVLESTDTRIIDFKRTENTKFLKTGGEVLKTSDFHLGDHLLIEASEDDQGFFTAINVVWEKEGTAAEKARAPNPTEAAPSVTPDEPTPPTSAAAKPPEAAPPVEKTVPSTRVAPADPDDERPVLRRGGPATRRVEREPQQIEMPAEPVPTVAVARPREEPKESKESKESKDELVSMVKPKEVDPVIEKARQMSESFTETLPNYLCKEMMTRYVSTTHKIDWRPQDIITIDMVYLNGREQYRNVAVNGKPSHKKLEEIGGAWSTGEFGTVLMDLFSPSTAAEFRFRRASTVGGRSALLYDYVVAREGSHWHVQVGGQSVMPAYRGSLWIDKSTNRVLRIEMEARTIPEAFPYDKVESATEYQFVRLGEREFLLPVHAETLMCQRGTNMCSRNVIDFRNYHRFSGESNLTFGDMPADDKPAAAPAPADDKKKKKK